MDYIKKIEESIKFAWNNKQLWWFGFIMAIFGGGSSGNFGNSFRNNNSGDGKMQEGIDKLNEFFDKPGVVLATIIFVLIMIVIALVGWYLASVAKAALVQSVRLDKEGKKMTFKQGWKFGQTKAFTIILLDLISLLIGLGIAVVLSPVIIISILVPPILCLLLCIAIPVFIVFAVIWAIAETGALRYIVLRNMGAWESLKAGWALAKKAYVEYVLGFFVSLLPGCVWAIVMMPLMLIAVVAILIIFVALVVANPLIGIIALLVFAILYMLVQAAVNSPYVVFAQTYWTKIIMELMDKYDRK